MSLLSSALNLALDLISMPIELFDQPLHVRQKLAALHSVGPISREFLDEFPLSKDARL
jgi:hypothetical protein